MRFVVLMTLGAAFALGGCASSQTSATTPAEGSCLPAGESAQELPRYLSIEVSAQGLRALGQPLGEDELRALAARESTDPTVRGVALTVEAGVSEAQAMAVVELLIHAGFRHLVFSSRDGLGGTSSEAPSAPQAGNSAEESVAPVAELPTNPASPDVAPSAADPEPSVNVEVKQLGLHIGGGPNTEQAHAAYAKPIQRRFGDLRSCYALAQGATKKASFGVDLLISGQGGKAKIKDYRTALAGKDFHLCVLGVFGSIEFPAPEKATVVSYSVLFKPL